MKRLRRHPSIMPHIDQRSFTSKRCRGSGFIQKMPILGRLLGSAEIAQDLLRRRSKLTRAKRTMDALMKQEKYLAALAWIADEFKTNREEKKGIIKTVIANALNHHHDLGDPILMRLLRRNFFDLAIEDQRDCVEMVIEQALRTGNRDGNHNLRGKVNDIVDICNQLNGYKIIGYDIDGIVSKVTEDLVSEGKYHPASVISFEFGLKEQHRLIRRLVQMRGRM